MPVITVELGKTEKQVKTELIRNLTTTASKATQIPEQSFIVLINERDDQNIGIGGKTLEEVKMAKK